MVDNSFPVRIRLRKNREFRAVYDAGKVLRSSCFVLIAMTAQQQKFGVVVSKKVGNAVVRNRLKRLVREWLRHNRTYIRGNFHVVIAARPPAAGLKGPEAMEHIDHLLQRAKFLLARE